MRGIFTAAALIASIAGTEALQLQKRSDGAAPRVVQHDIQRRETKLPPHVRDRLRRERRARGKGKTLSKRTGTITETLANEETLYFANISLGTPAQDIRLHIDTGSSDMWTNVATSAYCENEQDDCVGGYYAPNKSTTYEYVNSLFNITYEDGSGSAGDYVKDTFRIGGATITAQEFGVGYVSSSEEGILGIGYESNEAILEYVETPYVNVPAAMVEQGLINTNAYSLWLNDLDASTGSILFGGVNTDQYVGDLYTLPVIKEDDEYVEFTISFTGVGMDGNNGSLSSTLNTQALLDSGTSLMYIPDAIAEDIFKALDAEYDEEEGAAIIDCSAANDDKSVDFTFEGITISVALSELVIVAGYSGKTEVCILGIGLADGETPVLGDTFLRSAYVVYDLYLNEISLAQTDFNATSDNIVEITNSSIPDATGISSAEAAAQATSTGSSSDSSSVTSKGAAALMTAAPMLGAGALAALGFLAL